MSFVRVLQQKNRRQSGMSMAEVLMGLVLVGITIMASLTVVTGALTGTRNNMDRQFGTQKAIQMLEELRALIQATNDVNATILDDYDDGVSTQAVLTTQRILQGGLYVQPPPDSALSSNQPDGANWIYSRRVTVQRMPSLQSANVRLVRVAVFKNMPQGPRLLAEVASVLDTAITPFPPTQVYDVYALAIENVPGWWVFMSNLIPFVEGAITDLQSRNPGLEYRTHWIRKAAYGRNEMYTPYINTIRDSLQSYPSVYLYPGLMPVGSGDDFYYPPSFFSARMSVDGVVSNGYDPNPLIGALANPNYNPAPYTLADQYNHAMRQPQEQALFAARVAAGQEDPTAPTLRLLFDQMYTDPDRFRNAIVINLHGELMPFPAIRNYSDAAKLPDTLPNLRAVTHPEQLRYNQNDDVKLHVYSYLANPAGPNPPLNPLPYLNTQPIVVTIRGINWAPNQALGPASDIVAIEGGTDQDPTLPVVPGPEDYALNAAPTAPPPLAPNRMYFTATPVGPDTEIRLYNTPFRAPCQPTPVNCAQGGLFHASNHATRRLYGMEYIPSPTEDLTPLVNAPALPTQAFAENLTSPGDYPKNTARWVIRIPNAIVPGNRRIDVETRVGDTANAGTIYPNPIEPANRSVTYTWKGDDNWILGTPGNPANLPWTERFQFIGDPRHLPYSDLKRPHVGAGRGVNESALGFGYNAYHDDFEAFGPLSTNPWTGATLATYQNLMAAEMIGEREGAPNGGNPVTFNIPAGSRQFRIRVTNTIVGVVTVTTHNIQLATGAAVRITDIVNTLNANVAFFAQARASVWGNRLRITALAASSLLEFNQAALGDTPATPLGFRPVLNPATGDLWSIGRRGAWRGWQYNVAGVQYGVKNDGPTSPANDDNLNNDGWTGINRNNTQPPTNPPTSPNADDAIEIDMTRVFQTTRQAVQRTNGLWTTMTGWSYYYVGIGNEIGYDAQNGFPSSIPMHARAFDGTNGTSFEQSILGDTGGTWGPGVKYIVEDGTNWYAMSWLGELYPDNRYDAAGTTDWLGMGNLPTGAGGAGTFRRIRRERVTTTLYSNIEMPGTNYAFATRRLAGNGATTFFWTNTVANTFRHTGGANTDQSNRMAAGTEIATRYAMPVPAQIGTARPFGVNIGGGTTPDDFLAPGYTPANRTDVLAEFFQWVPNNTLDGSSLLATVDPATPTNVMYVVANGISPGVALGNAFIARWSLLTLIHSYFVAGQFSYTAPATINITGAPTDASRVKQLPQVTITNPNLQTQISNPLSINVTWAINWRRWDGGPYTNAYSAAALALDQAIPLSHRVLYSRDNGRTWLHAIDDSAAVEGERPTNPFHLQAGTAFTWDVSNVGSFPQGNYLLRVETYRNALPLHYSFHQFRAFIDR